MSASLRGRRITTFNRLLKLKDQRKAVMCSHWKRHNTAAFLCNMSLNVVGSLIRAGLHEYRRAK